MSSVQKPQVFRSYLRVIHDGKSFCFRKRSCLADLHSQVEKLMFPGASLQLWLEVAGSLNTDGSYDLGVIDVPLGPGYGGAGILSHIDLIAAEQFSCEGLGQ